MVEYFKKKFGKIYGKYEEVFGEKVARWMLYYLIAMFIGKRVVLVILAIFGVSWAI